MSFDSIAPHYRWMEPLLAGRKLQRCRTGQLHHVAAPQSVLILGEGPGKFLVAFRRRFSEAGITCVDSSRRMLALAEQRLRSGNLPLVNTRFVHANALEYVPPAGAFDLIATHFFLDCFPAEELRLVIAKLARAATPQATWLLSDFTVPSSGFSRLRARMIHRIMYLFFRAVTGLRANAVTPPDRLLREHGFELRERFTSNLGLLHSDLWSR